MERNSTNDNFEHFLQQNAEDFRIHPSPKVWEGVSKNLNKRKRRFYFGFITFLVSSSIIGYSLFELSPPAASNGTVETPVPSRPADKLPIEQKPGNNTGDNNDITPKTTIEHNNPEIEERGAVVRPISSAPSFLNKLVIEKTTNDLTAGENPTDLTEEKLQRESWSANLLSAAKPGGLDRSALLLNNASAANSFMREEKTTEEQAQPELTTPSEIAKPYRKNSKFSMMFFFTPTISYRKLSENKSYLRSSQAYNFALYDINNAVTHKPDIGLELGLTTKYALTKNVKLRAGVQFNINRYDIKAFQYRPEIATIALNNGYGVDSLSTLSNYRNFNGGKTDWLQNFYFQVSTPVGIEVKLHGNDKMHIGIASTVQPTYLIGDRAYIITADYKNYAEVPWLVRRWNVNTNLETFVSYSTGKVKWQVGPQVRYQLLSSFVSEYPIKENLFDFGLKVGISLNQNQ